LLGVVLAGVVGSVGVSLGSFFAVFGRLPGTEDVQWPAYLIALPVLGLGSYVSTVCNAVVVATASLRLRGQPATARDGLRLVRAQLPRLLLYTTISLTLGYLLHIVAERVKLGGVIARWLVDLAWALATALIVPVLLFEDLGVRPGIKRSASLFRQKWGETVTAAGGVGLAVFVVAVALCPLLGLVALVSVPLAVALGVALAGATMVLAGALDGVVTAALYQYAVDGTVLARFDETDLASAWRPTSD
jgi:hypothetical protein